MVWRVNFFKKAHKTLMVLGISISTFGMTSSSYGIEPANPYSFDRWSVTDEGQSSAAAPSILSSDQAHGFANFDD